MATLDIKAPVFRGLNYSQFVTVAKASGQTFEAGDLITIASGEATDYSNDSQALAVAGEAASHAEAPAGSPNEGVVNVNLLHDNVLCEFSFSGTYAQSDLGIDYGLVLSSGVVVVDKSETGTVCVRPLQLVKGAVGDTNVRVLCRFLPEAVY